MEINSVSFFNNNPYHLPSTVGRPIIIGWNIINPQNCGSILRIADTIGCMQVLFVKNDRQNLSDRLIKKTAGDSYNRVNFKFVSEENWMDTLPTSHKIVGIETATNSKNIFTSNLPKNIAILVGNEKKGIPEAILNECTELFHIPLTGHCTSLNVTHATTVAIFEWLRQTLY